MKNESKKITRKLKEKWQLKQGDIKVDDRVFHVSFFGKYDNNNVLLSSIQVNMGFRIMTKWELFKHLCWRIWKRN